MQFVIKLPIAFVGDLPRHEQFPYLRVYQPHFFLQEFTLQNWGAAYAWNIMSF
jgi:hypothetical protein